MPLQWSKCFAQIFNDYCNNTTINGWKYLVDKERTVIERLLWWIIEIIAIASAVFLFYVICGNFWDTPTITTLTNTNFDIRNIPFPAIAVCDVNRISAKEARKFAKSYAPELNVSVEKMVEFIRYFGRLYDYDDENMEILNELNTYLDMNQNNNEFNYSRYVNLMLSLTPDPRENILKCSWKSENRNCSDIFGFKRTMDGFCSTFNYYKSQDHVFVSKYANALEDDNSIKYVHSSGLKFGLNIIVKSDTTDYFYPLSALEGIKIFIYNCRDYPDVASGNLVETLIPLGSEVFIQIDPITIEAAGTLRNYTQKQRRCTFSDEKITAFDSQHYSHSDCLTECKLKSILALCECIPFYMAVSTKLHFYKQLCTTADVGCLNKYKEKWNTMSPEIPGQKVPRELLGELHNSIECDNCLPDCSYTKYRVLNEYAPLSNNNPILEGYNNSEISLVHIYFDVDSTVIYKTDLVYYWYDIVSNFGGMCGVFVGFGLISIIEFFYFFVFKFIILLIRTRHEN